MNFKKKIWENSKGIEKISSTCLCQCDFLKTLIKVDKNVCVLFESKIQLHVYKLIAMKTLALWNLLFQLLNLCQTPWMMGIKPLQGQWKEKTGTMSWKRWLIPSIFSMVSLEKNTVKQRELTHFSNIVNKNVMTQSCSPLSNDKKRDNSCH